jgi:hypothetical protein
MPLLEVLGLHRRKATPPVVASAPAAVPPAAGKRQQVAAPQAHPRANYQTKRQECFKLLGIFKRLHNDPVLQRIETQLTTIDTEVKAGRLAHAAAIPRVDAIRQNMGLVFSNIAVGQPMNRVVQLKRSPAAAFMAADIKQLEQLVDEVRNAVNSGDHARALLGARQLRALAETAQDVAERRSAYDTQKSATGAALSPLRAYAALQAQVAALDQQVVAADALAERGAMQFEAGVAALQKVQQRAGALLQFATAGDTLAKERAAAVKALAALRKHAAAKAIAEPLEAVDSLLAQAAQTATDAAAANNPAGIENARASVARAMSDLAALKTMADGLAPALRASAGNARASAALVAKAEHKRYADLRATIDKRRAALLALPIAAAIAGKTDAVARALAQAQQHDAAKEGMQAIAALHHAEDGLIAGEAAAAARAAFDTRVASLLAGRAGLLEGDAGVAFEKQLTKARTQADSFAFDSATRTLDKAQAGLEKLTVMQVAVLNPTSPALLDGARKLLKLGGAAQLDEVVAALPTSVPESVIAQLAQERFGVTFDLAAGSPGTASVKQIYGMLAKVPEHVVGNPSLKTIRPTARPGGSKLGGQYIAEQETAEIYGRPGADKQKFGAERDKAEKKPQLPADVEESCLPANTDAVETMDWTALHEIGHSLDDANNFMRSKGGDDEYGGWIEYGAKIEPIAGAVAAWAHFDKSAAQKRYVVDLILANQPQVPPAPAGLEKEAKNALAEVQRWHKTATTPEVWKDEAASKSMCIGERIYQMPYPDEWVSYKVAARRRGLTGFQFKAPGEWFAELYAGYKSGKLKPGHPALKWLSKIKV